MNPTGRQDFKTNFELPSRNISYSQFKIRIGNVGQHSLVEPFKVEISAFMNLRRLTLFEKRF